MNPESQTAPTLLNLIGVLLRAPLELLGKTDDGTSSAEGSAGMRERLATLTPRLLAITVLGAATLGLVIGSYRGEIQYLYAAIKTPALLLLPMLIGLPAIRAFHAACEVELAWSRLALTAVIAVARTAVLAAASSPVLWLYLSIEPGYHEAILAMAAALIVVGAPGLWTFIQALPAGGRQRPLANFASFAVLGVLLAQSGWLLRPFVVRPRAEVEFLRPIEADVFSSLATTRRSAAGDFRGWDPSTGGLFGRAVTVESTPAVGSTPVEVLP